MPRRVLQDADLVEQFGTQPSSNDPPDTIIAAVVVAQADNQRLHNRAAAAEYDTRSFVGDRADTADARGEYLAPP
jgi:hypothetical protein